MQTTLKKFLCFLALMGVSGGVAHSSCLPPQVANLLHSNYSDMKIVELQDLEADDQQILKDAHKQECPGVARGNFDGTGLSYAVTMFSESPELRQMLVVVGYGSSNGHPKLRVLAGPEHVARLSIVRRLPPGNLESPEGVKARADYDAIVYEALEAGVLVYYFSGGKFLSILTAE